MLLPSSLLVWISARFKQRICIAKTAIAEVKPWKQIRKMCHEGRRWRHLRQVIMLQNHSKNLQHNKIAANSATLEVSLRGNILASLIPRFAEKQICQFCVSSQRHVFIHKVKLNYRNHPFKQFGLKSDSPKNTSQRTGGRRRGNLGQDAR